MDTIRIILTWGGVGVAIGIGIVAVIAVAVKLCSFYDKLFPKKNLPAYDFLENELNSMGRDYIVFSYDLKLVSSLIKEKISKLRNELWAKDFVLPNVSICTANFPVDKNCIIRLEGKELFNGEIEPTLSNEDKADFIIKQLNIYFASKMIGRMGGKNHEK
jgi:hypothetical protein